ncbi:FadR/GntR family transcriptional regulator [Brachybacterium sp.]|uniref:FadR/GntR family transcriptional regulator n=1 Tax=Brachybacterium sp. TaxID=1891286 RepID=UPI002ED40BC3
MDDLDATARKHIASPTLEDSGERLERGSLADRARAAVLGLIDEQGLSAGDPLPATGALAERFGVSRTVVREALSALAALGIIEVSNGRSAAVRELDPSLVRFYLSRAIRESRDDGFTTLMDLRGPLEVRAARRAAERFASADGRSDDAGRSAADGHVVETAPGRERLTELRNRLDAALADSALYPQLDLQLHQEIALLSGNRALHGLLEAVSVPLFHAMQEVRAARDLQGLVGAEHVDHLRIIDAILAGDPDAASAAMEHHMRAVEAFTVTP